MTRGLGRSRFLGLLSASLLDLRAEGETSTERKEERATLTQLRIATLSHREFR